MSLRFVLGIINSRANQWHWQQRCYDQKRTFPKVKKPDLLSIPIPRLDQALDRDVARHDRLASLVDQMLALHKSLAAAQSPADKEALQRRVDSTDRQIDRLVYDLYGLTDDEIRIVEEATR